VAAQLNLNVDLVEALALVHDVGHPPFGHAGEKALDTAMRRYGLFFDHNLHALRIVEDFELRYAAFRGLNLTFEVREGIIKHSRDYDGKEFPELREYSLEQLPPLEAQLIDIADEIAYNTADLDDAREAELLDLDLLRSDVPLFGDAYARVARAYPAAKEKLKFSEALKNVLNALASDLIETTAAQAKQSGIATVDEIRRYPRRFAGLSHAIAEQNTRLKQFLIAHLYTHPVITEDRDHSIECLERLFHLFLGNRGSMPPDHEEQALIVPRHIVVCDYIAGMTDQFLLRQYRDHFGAPPQTSSASS
jgi:dGTPase